MTEIPVAPSEPTEPPTPTELTPPRARSRRRLIIGLVVGLAVVVLAITAVVAVIGVQLVLSIFGSKALVPYTSTAENYSVVAPGEATQKQEDVIGAIPTTFTYWTDGEAYFSISSTDGEDLPPSARGVFLYAALSGALKDAPGVSASSLESSAVTDAFLTEPEEITISGETAYVFPLTVEGAPTPFKVVFAGHGSALYMMVYSDSADSSDEDFIDSFAYLD
jgi:hypothetical protein